MIPDSWTPPLLDSATYFVELGAILVPLFIVASFIVGLVKQYLPPERVETTLKRYDGGSGNVVAAGVGAVTPFCSCSTVPILAGILQAGAPVGLAFSFLLASPLVNWIAVLLLLGLFGPVVALGYVAVTLTLAIVGGLVLGQFSLGCHVRDIARGTPDGSAVADGGEDRPVEPVTTATAVGTARGTAGTRSDQGCGGAESSCSASGGTTAGCGKTRPEHIRQFRAAWREAWRFFTEMFPYLLLGLVLAALLYGVVPRSLLLAVLGPANPLAVPLAALAGAPVYVSMEVVLAIGASFVDQGIPIGTVLAFVIGGAGVSIPNLIMLYKLFEWRLLVLYVLAVVSIGMSVGLLFNLVLV